MVKRTIQRVRGNAFAMNSAILFGGTMLGSVLNYFFHLLMGRLLSVEIYGEVQSLTALVNIVSVPAMTLMMIAMKYSAANKADDDKRGSYEIMKYLSQKVLKYGIPIFIVALLITPFISDFLKIDSNIPVFFIWIMMLLSFFGSINLGILQGWQKFMSASWVGVWGAAAKLFSGVLLVWIGFGLNGAIGAFALGVIASYVASLITLRFIFKAREKSDSNVNKITFQSIRSYVIPVFIGNLAINILGNADMVLAKHNLDDISAGQYGALTIVSKIIFFTTGVIVTVMFSMSAEDSHKQNNPLIILRNAVYLMLFVSVSAIIIYFAFPDFVFGIFFGAKYLDVSNYLGWFAIMVTLFSFTNIIFQYLLSIHRVGIVYSFLTISIISSFLVLFIGKTISDILWIVVIAHVVSILVGIFYLFSKKSDKVNV